jgi:hypothetical protein
MKKTYKYVVVEISWHPNPDKDDAETIRGRYYTKKEAISAKRTLEKKEKNRDFMVDDIKKHAGEGYWDEDMEWQEI